VFLYRDHPSYSGFSNFFRYKLLMERGGWWVDLGRSVRGEVRFSPRKSCFSSEPVKEGGRVPTTGFLKSPPGSEVMTELWQVCQDKDPSQIYWGEDGSGPAPACRAPVSGWRRACRRVTSSARLNSPSGSDCSTPPRPGRSRSPRERFHLWNEMWRRAGRDKNATYHPDCLYERLKATYGVTAASVAGIVLN